jgi:uroporphyrinogen decarboxylase
MRVSVIVTMLRDPALATSAFLQTCAGRQTDVVPVWFMRQAGRSLPEYRRVREGVTMLESCRLPEMVTEITLQPVQRYGVDAAILYSDIVVPLKAVGVDLDVVQGVGPVVAEPFRTREDLDRIPELDAVDIPFITEAVTEIVRALGPTPLIGFAGAPFTLASYLIEGGPSRDLTKTKALMYGDPQLWRDLLMRLSQIAGEFLRVQVAAGASAVQLFDSWVGALPAADYRAQVLPASAAVFSAVRALDPTVPRIHFGVGTGELLTYMASAGANVMGVDFRVPLEEAARRTGGGTALQGNLDPAILFAPWDVIAQRVRAVLASGGIAPGHIFNLGHGVPPGADPDILARIVDLVHAGGEEYDLPVEQDQDPQGEYEDDEYEDEDEYEDDEELAEDDVVEDPAPEQDYDEAAYQGGYVQDAPGADREADRPGARTDGPA